MFKYGQAVEDPRDGLTLFGPLDQGKPYGVRAGVLGTKDGIARFVRWVERIQKPVMNDPPQIARPPFPGFETAFQIPWNPEPALRIEIPTEELKTIFLSDKHQRVYKTVQVFSDRIIQAIKEEDTKVDIWFVIIPDDVYQYCRPLSSVDPELQIPAMDTLPVAYAKQIQTQSSLFEQDNIAAIPYHYEVNFHNQLKARLLAHDAPTQIVKESTVAPYDFLNQFGRPTRNLDEQESAIAWNIATAVFYKAGGRPWKIGSIRDGVCYIGLVFKIDEKNPDPRTACCAAQMFLDSGDGIVFKGDVGPWYSGKKGEFHLKRKAAQELIKIALDSFKDRRGGEAPKELFIHGKVRFNDEEWKAFESGVDEATNLVGVKIRNEVDLKIYRKGDMPILRGQAYIRDSRSAYLWTRGYIPRLKTYIGREVPNPLAIEVCRGEAAIDVVLQDILSLTKLNYNACMFADGLPVTLRFANAVGEILTAGPLGTVPPLSFKYYI
ncbi:MAG: hypothetical protein M1282_06560 [Chloroflexi bacterium]|nr:hypothetical protein [Chloroflexota bacterium]